jgi:sulfatase maturation enzyme AslB (radical SAM superfamily)
MTEKTKKMLSLASRFKKVDSESFFLAEQAKGEPDYYYSPGFATTARGALDPKQLAHLRRASAEALNSKKNSNPELALTLFLHNDCNLDCSYCLRKKNEKSAQKLCWDDLNSHLSRIIKNCKEASVPVTVIFHGWGEPLLYPDQVRELTEKIDDEIRQSGLERFFYIATNGVLNEEQIELLTSRFDLVGLSCDGLPTSRSGRGCDSHQLMLQTADSLRASATLFDVRMTVTPDTVEAMSDNVSYIAKRLSPNAIRLEPQYAHQEIAAFSPDDVQNFYHHFMLAKNSAKKLGYDLQTSLSRPEEAHGPYCNPLRGVCNIMPDGKLTPCFADYDGSKAERFLEKSDGGECFHSMPVECGDCFNQYHCVRGCPEFCLLQEINKPRDSFRCLLSQLISVDWILKHCQSGV